MTNKSAITALTELAMSSYQFAVQGNRMSQLTLATMATGDPFLDGILRFNSTDPREEEPDLIGPVRRCQPSLICSFCGRRQVNLAS
jgi:hypothetical protein